MPDFGITAPGQEITVLARVTGVRWIESQNTGNRGLEFIFGDFSEGNPDPFGDGRSGISKTVWITPNNANIATKSLKVLGFDADTCSAADAKRLREDPEDLFMRREAALVCALKPPDDYHKAEYWDVKWINSPHEAPPAQFDPIAMLRGRERSQKKKANGQASLPVGESTKPAPVAKAVRSEDDDVPF